MVQFNIIVVCVMIENDNPSRNFEAKAWKISWVELDLSECSELQCSLLNEIFVTAFSTDYSVSTFTEIFTVIFGMKHVHGYT
jgi:hypothetical protein